MGKNSLFSETFSGKDFLPSPVIKMAKTYFGGRLSLPVGISPTRLLAEFNPLRGRTLSTDLPSIALRHITNSHFGERPFFARRHVKNVAAGRVQPTSGKNSFCRIALSCPQAYHKPPTSRKTFVDSTQFQAEPNPVP